MPTVNGLGPREDTLPDMFFARAAAAEQMPFLHERRNGVWRKTSWFKMADNVLVMATALKQRGITPGDRVILVSENRSEWIVAELAIMLVGAISVPLFTTNTAIDFEYLVQDSGARAVICSTSKLAAQLFTPAQESASCHLMVVMEPGQLRRHPAGLAIVNWDQMMTEGRRGKPNNKTGFPSGNPDDVCSILYTTNNTDKPRGVMLTHRSIMANLAGCEGLLREVGLGQDVFLSMLPFSHAYEHSVGLYFPIHLGAQIHILPRPEALNSTIADVRPTIMTTVPRLLELLRDRIRQNFVQRGALALFLFEKAISLGTKKLQGETLTLIERIQNTAADIFIRRAVRARLGGRLKAFVSGGAALDPSIGYFFLALGIRPLQGYGKTEASSVITANPPSHIKIETVGTPLAGVSVQLTQTGELCVKGPLVMAGYWNDPIGTSKALRDGWYHTGDLAEIHEDGYITLTGRKNDVIVNTNGEDISPSKVEAILEAQREIAFACVFGNRQPFLTAVICPSDIVIRQFGDRQERIKEQLQEAVATANVTLSQVERIRTFIVADDIFSQENKLLSASGRKRRSAIIAAYEERLIGLYRRPRR